MYQIRKHAVALLRGNVMEGAVVAALLSGTERLHPVCARLSIHILAH